MEASPLTKAHDHARAAAMATRQSSDSTVAISEHTLAAGEFANAARNTSSVEALRTLKLLEEHHRKLAEILKLPPEQTSQCGDGDDLNEKEPLADALADDMADKESSLSSDPSSLSKAAPPALSQRYASREMTSSIASNLASARGIRSKYRGQPLSPSVSNDQAPGNNVEPPLRRDGSRVRMQSIMENSNSSSNSSSSSSNQPGRPAWVPPMPTAAEGSGKGSLSIKADVRDDGGYARFYNTFGSLINKISAPLAFAGLPLIQEEPTTPSSDANEAASSSPSSTSPSTRPSHARISPTSGTEPDLSKIYSRATLRALARDGHVATDSFYVVPSTGHTMSYANILSYAEKEKRRLEASVHGDLGPSIHDDDDDFVDARESPALQLSPGVRRRIGRAAPTDRELRNMVEELSMENKSLKDMLDKLTKRLHTFEASAQSMAESYRMMRPGSPLSGGGGGTSGGGTSGGGGSEATRKNHELEEQLSAAMSQMERLEKDNRKMQKTLDKYREKWETLKAGAKARREAQVTAESIEDARSIS